MGSTLPIFLCGGKSTLVTEEGFEIKEKHYSKPANYPSACWNLLRPFLFIQTVPGMYFEIIQSVGYNNIRVLQLLNHDRYTE